MVKVLFVCTGNICRSPSAEGVFRALLKAEGLTGIETDSAGTHGYHIGEPPDPRSCQAALARGVDLRPLRARQVEARDFRDFDLVVAMDRGHLAHLEKLCPPAERHRLALFMTFAPGHGTRDVPDPYYGAGDGFERVLDLIEAGSRGLIAHLRERLG
ncbi:MAG: low molecular weight phosphotyrosine protein phosphatase [Alphaproteobacteria bacterium]|nr:low molecular weight phosphotyrosine protein phosphatase [Alphaproteobacteria bacterium]